MTIESKSHLNFLQKCKSTNKRTSNRIQAVLLNSEGLTSSQISLQLKQPLSRVSEWLRRFEADGIKGLFDRKRSGRPSKLGQNQSKVKSMIEQGPQSKGYAAFMWNPFLLRQVLSNNYGVTYHEGHIRKMLSQNGQRKQHRYKNNWGSVY